jgi:hypothetical protein
MYVPQENHKKRIDVITWPPHINGYGLVLEIQHTPISPEEIFQRADDYAGMGLTQAWLSIWKDGLYLEDNSQVEKYSAPPFERWIQGFNHGNGLWYFDPKIDLFRWARVDACWLTGTKEGEWIPGERDSYGEWSDGYYERGEEYTYQSKRWRTLKLLWSCPAENLMFAAKQRKEATLSYHHWPKCSRGVVYDSDALSIVRQEKMFARAEKRRISG